MNNPDEMMIIAALAARDRLKELEDSRKKIIDELTAVNKKIDLFRKIVSMASPKESAPTSGAQCGQR